jgi:hypothetical protein
LNNLESPAPKDDLCQVWLKLANGSGEEVKNSLPTDGWTKGYQKSSLELSAQVS